jgi:hypothetical protein
MMKMINSDDSYGESIYEISNDNTVVVVATDGLVNVAFVVVIILKKSLNTHLNVRRKNQISFENKISII